MKNHFFANLSLVGLVGWRTAAVAGIDTCWGRICFVMFCFGFGFETLSPHSSGCKKSCSIVLYGPYLDNKEMGRTRVTERTHEMERITRKGKKRRASQVRGWINGWNLKKFPARASRVSLFSFTNLRRGPFIWLLFDFTALIDRTAMQEAAGGRRRGRGSGWNKIKPTHFFVFEEG